MYTMMIVEDEEIIRKGLVNTIDWNDIGFKVIAEAEDGEEALELFQKYKPDVILTDIKIPMMDGLELLKEIKKIDNEKEIVLLSGYEDFSYAKRGIEYNAFSYILKINMYEEIKPVFSKLYHTLQEKGERQKHLQELLSFNHFQQVLKGLKGFENNTPLIQGNTFCVLCRIRAQDPGCF